VSCGPAKFAENQEFRLHAVGGSAQAFRLSKTPWLVQKAAMMRRASCLVLALLAAGCVAKTPSPAPVPAIAAIPPAPPRGEPGLYLNMAAPGLQAAFGRPAFVRKDGATEMWRYDGAACRAFFFLYGAPLTVRHVETLPHGTQNAADDACLTALRASPTKTS
jgi:hypothetical protein